MPHIRIDIFTEATESQRVADALMESVYTGAPGDGIVAVHPVEMVYHIGARGGAPAEPV